MTQPGETDFKVVAFFAADHAVVEGGKVYVNGGFWTRMMFPSFPAVQPAIGLVAVIEVPWRAYHQDHRFSIGLEDEDGRRLPLNIEGEFRVGAAPDLKKGDPSIMSVAVAVNNLTLERAGDYAFTLSIDGSEVARYTVRAVQVAIAVPGVAQPPPEQD